MARLRLGVLASGRGSNLEAIWQAIQAGDLQASLELVLSDRPQAQALERARNWGVATACCPVTDYERREEHDAALASALQEVSVELVVLAGYMRKLSPTFVHSFERRIVNIHPSLLPAFPGLHAQRQAVQAGVSVSGCSVHLVDEGLDTGPVIGQRAVPVLPSDDEEALSSRILRQEHILYPRVLQWWAAGCVCVEGKQVRVLPR